MHSSRCNSRLGICRAAASLTSVSSTMLLHLLALSLLQKTCGKQLMLFLLEVKHDVWCALLLRRAAVFGANGHANSVILQCAKEPCQMLVLTVLEICKILLFSLATLDILPLTVLVQPACITQ